MTRHLLVPFWGLLFLIGCSPQISIEEQMEDSRSAIRRKDHPTAQRLLDQILSRDPQNYEARLFRAQLARDMGDEELALKELAKVPDEARKFASVARFIEGSIALTIHDASTAEAKLIRSAELNPTYLQPHDRLIQLYVLQRRKEDLLRQIEAISQIRPLRLTELALQLSAAERTVDPKDGISQLELYLTKNPNDNASQLALASYYNESVRPREAIAVLRNLVNNEPDNKIARGLLAEILVEQQDLSGAAKLLDQIELTSNDPVELWRSSGSFFLACEEWERAAQCFGIVAARDSLDRSAYRRLGLALQRLGNPVLAEIALRRTALIAQLREHCETLGIMMARNKITAKSLIELANQLAGLEEPDRASVWYEQALRLDPKASEAEAGIQALQRTPMNTVTQLLAKIPRPNGPVSLKTTKKLTTSDQETAPSTNRSVIQFQDDHEVTGLNFSYYNGKSGFQYLIESMGGGVGVIDFDHDGWPDLFFPQGNDMLKEESKSPGNWHDQLFRNLGGTGFVSVPAQAGVGDPGYGMGVAVGDFDNDGFDDLLVTNFGRCSMLKNQGDGTFLDVTTLAGLNRQEMSTSAGWADFDQDGFLDLFIVNYVDSLKVCRNDKGEISTCSPSNHIGVDDRLFINLGDGQFQDASSTSGLLPGGKGLGLMLADLDDDGLVDAFVANDTTPNFFYRNRSSAGHPNFIEEGLLATVALSDTGIAQAGMGIACGDLNGDLRLDLYVTYFYREANGLYLNLGEGVFREATRASGLYQPTLNMLGFGTQAIDFDLDGYPELVVANGHIDDQRALGIPWKMPPQLFVSGGAQKYADRSREAGEYFQGEYLGRGVARIDWNRDGRPDFVVVHQDRPVALLSNKTVQSGKFIELQLRSPKGNRNAIGAKVLVTCGDQTQRLDLTGGDGFCCANEQKLIFGVGNHERINQIEIVWPGGRHEVFSDLPSRSRWIVIEGSQPISMSQ